MLRRLSSFRTRTRSSVSTPTSSEVEDSTVTLIFRCGANLFEDSFRLSQTVHSVKEAISRRIPGAHAGQLGLELNGNELVVDDQRLSEIFPRGGFVSEAILVTGLPRELIDTSASRSSSPVSWSTSPAQTKRAGQPSPVAPVTPETVSSSVQGAFLDSENPLVVAIKPILDLPSDQVIDELRKVLDIEVDARVILVSVYATAMEECTTIEEQAHFVANKILEFGLHDGLLRVEEPPVDLPVDFDDGDSRHSDVPPVTCPVCFDDHPRAEVFEFMCGLDQEDQKGGPHALCYECAQDHVKSFASQRNPNVKCYMNGCGHELSQNEIALILGRGDTCLGKRDPIFNTIDILQLDFVVGQYADLYASCPGPDCKYFVARSENGAMERANCPQCDLNFCTNCLRTYHYRTTCTQVRQVEEDWRTWTVSDRAKYWRDDTEMRRKAQAMAEAERQRIEAVRKAEHDDEQWKAANCRHCPHCNRLVNRIGGCKAMRCGYDTDTGGNVQDGCRQSFPWEKAEPYTPVKAGTKVKMTATPEHEKRPHPFWKCSLCNGDIVGLRFDCVNCASFSICERCEAEHSSDHTPGHFFQIVHPPTDVQAVEAD